MTFFYFLRGLWLRVSMPIRRFYADTAWLGDPFPFPSDEYIAKRKAEKEAIEGGARLTSRDHPLLNAAPAGKPAGTVAYVIEHPSSVLCPDCRKATADLLKRNQQAREQALNATS